jgi:NADPH-dependent stearoyl-CoA 9-desaturase
VAGPQAGPVRTAWPDHRWPVPLARVFADFGPAARGRSHHLSYQVEHHLYPDMPSSRCSEIAPKVKDICERYALPYNSGRFSKQWFTVHRSIFRLAFPGGKPRPKPGPYHSPERHTGADGASEASRFRDRLPAEHPNAGPEHESGGVEVQPPPRGKD